ncbi:CDP-diacylglycerol O-phosphatidyltransferase [Novosphingobium sp. AAP83]|uniref:CDP-alcohol phosphatidyltransferase family protein n=1 Tax=Novosphingobium sp. AAP83 TaxID=1523425 RepID=UPI0006B9AAFD|nr:phosphatidylcholine/phosphatidylserine synthase [Novosphingobium sp. AAP83]KPF91995.1 CDP-diacylglycerol O-phosphatidyltransferase [Novosphingobium sp. AAP83]
MISPGDENAPRRGRLPGGLTLRAMTPNAITTAALCSGLTGIRFAVTAASGTDPVLVAEDWRKAVAAVILAGLLDGIDGRIARLLKAQSRFGAELDSLADNVSFGVAPALILFLWSLQEAPRIGWFAALAVAIACALRLARFNAQIDVEHQPHKSAGFLTGIPAPVAAGLAFLPMYLWIATDNPVFRLPIVVGPWLVLIAFLMISNIATLGWTALRPRRSVRLELIALVGLVTVALLTEPWLTLVGICAVYLLFIPLGVMRYAKVKRQRAASARTEPNLPA